MIALLYRFIIYVFGVFALALGVSFSIKSNLGVSPVNSIPYVMSKISHIDMGVCTTIVLTSFIFVQIILMKKEFKVKNLLQLISASLFGSCVSFANNLTHSNVVANHYIIQLLYCFLGIVCVAIGVYTYLGANVLSLPAEGVMEAIVHKFKIQMSSSKIIFDCSVVAIASLLSFIALAKVDGVREGTVFAAIGVGFCIKIIVFLKGKLS